MKKLALAALFALIFGNILSAALVPSNFRYKAEADAPLKAGRLYRVDLPADVLRYCSAGQSDIRIFSPDGAELPYVLLKGEYLKKAAGTYQAEILSYQDKGGEAAVEFRIGDKSEPVTRLELSIADKDFRKEAELYGNESGKWVLLAKGEIYDFSSQIDLRRTTLVFPASSHRLYRLVLRDTEAPRESGKTVSFKYDGIDLSVTGGKGVKLRINGVALRTGGADSAVRVYNEMSFPAAAPEILKNNDSYVHIAGGLPFERVEFEVEDGFFMRNFRAFCGDAGKPDSYGFIGGGTIYRFPPGWPEGEKLGENISSPGHGGCRFVFSNRNNPPLNIRSVRLKWLRRSLYFIAPADMPGVTVSFGRPGTPRPVYDIENFINQGNWHTKPAEELTLGGITPVEGYSPEAPGNKKERTEKNLLIGIIVAVAIGLGFWFYHLLKSAPGKPR